MSAIEKPLSNLQIELLKLYSMDVSEEELIEVRRLLSQFFADKASDEMDRLWQENNWSDETMDNWLKGEEGATQSD